MRVAHVMAGAVHGGAELFYERLCIGMHSPADPVLPVIRSNPHRAALLRAHGMEPRELCFGGPADLLTRPLLKGILTSWRPDVVVSWMNRAAGSTPAGPWRRVGRLGGYYALRHYRGCDHLIGNTRGITAWLVSQGWPPERVHYLPNFVADFAETGPAVELLDRRHVGRPVLLGLGRLHTDKGFDTLIRALARLPDPVLVIAGEGPEHAALARLARDEGVADRVAFLGWRDDAGALLKAADLFVCSSRIEPLGNMVIEAWSAARPVVAIAAAGPAELIRDGVDGVLTGLEDPAALAGAINRLLRDPAYRARLADAGRARFVAEFAASAVIGAWRGVLRCIHAGEPEF